MSRHDDFSRQTPGRFMPPDLGPDAVGVTLTDPLNLARPVLPQRGCGVSAMIDRGQVHPRNRGLLTWPTPSGRRTGPMMPEVAGWGAPGQPAVSGWPHPPPPPPNVHLSSPQNTCHGGAAYSFLLPGLCAGPATSPQKGGTDAFCGPAPVAASSMQTPLPPPFAGLFGGVVGTSEIWCCLLLFLLVVVIAAVVCGGRSGGAPLLVLLRDGDAQPAAASAAVPASQ